MESPEQLTPMGRKTAGSIVLQTYTSSSNTAISLLPISLADEVP